MTLIDKNGNLICDACKKVVNGIHHRDSGDYCDICVVQDLNPTEKEKYLVDYKEVYGVDHPDAVGS